jgi:hypothetical protein
MLIPSFVSPMLAILTVSYLDWGAVLINGLCAHEVNVGDQVRPAKDKIHAGFLERASGRIDLG